MDKGGCARGVIGGCLGSVFSLASRTHTHTQHLEWGGEADAPRCSSSVSPVGGAAVAGLVALALLLHVAGLVALPWATLSVLGQMVVQQLGVRLLVGGQDVEEGSRGVARGSSRVQGACAPQGRWQAEGRGGARMEALLVK